MIGVKLFLQIFPKRKIIFTMAKRKRTLSNNLDDIILFDPEQENLDFPSICRFIRQSLNVTQQQMAQKLKIDLSTYTYWEYGKHVPKGWQALNLGLIYLHAKDVVAEKELANQKTDENSCLESTAPENQAA
ncbi:MAG: helix-turn-helix domain-containing protein [Blastocatellia bacterium]